MPYSEELKFYWSHFDYIVIVDNEYKSNVKTITDIHEGKRVEYFKLMQGFRGVRWKHRRPEAVILYPDQVQDYCEQGPEYRKRYHNWFNSDIMPTKATIIYTVQRSSNA